MLRRKALVGGCLALPLAGFAGTAHARPPQPERVIRVPAGSIVLVLPRVAVSQEVTQTPMMPAFAPQLPMLRLMAAQDAMMQQMLQQVRVLDQWSMALPDPGQIIRAATMGMRQQAIPAGTTVMTSVVSNGRNVCRETVTYHTTPNGERPQVHIVRTGGDCGALRMQGPVGAAQMLPGHQAEPQRSAPDALPQQRRLWTIDDPARPAVAHAPRT